MSGNEWFQIGDVNMQWLNASPRNKTSQCDQCATTVGPWERRLRIDDGKGRYRKGGKGKHNSYLCEGCGTRRAG